METLQPLMESEITRALGWTVLHTLWQGLILAAVLVLLLRYGRPLGAELRYWTGFALLLVQLVAAVITFYWVYEPPVAGEVVYFFTDMEPLTVPVLLNMHLPALEPASWWELTLQRLEGYLPLIVMAWWLGMIVSLARLALGLWYIRRLRHEGLHPLGAIWHDTLADLSRHLGLRRDVALAESRLVESPLLIGQLKPLILLPIGLVNQLTPEQVEAILAHELAHLRRYDYWLNLMQSVIEAIFCYHPAIWWISAQVRDEREHCCDDLAVRLCGDSLLYARTLLEVEERCAPVAAVALTGRPGSFVRRIHRLLNHPKHQLNMKEKFIVLSLVMGTLLFFSAGAGLLRPLQAAIPGPLWDELAIAEPVLPDTLPRGPLHFRMKDEKRDVEVSIERGEITHLEIDGREIPAEEYGQYEQMVEELIDEIPPPPLPPAPPMHGVPPTPPMPPTPPAPPAHGYRYYIDGDSTGMFWFGEGMEAEDLLELYDGALREAHGSWDTDEWKALRFNVDSMIRPFEGRFFHLDGEPFEFNDSTWKLQWEEQAHAMAEQAREIARHREQLLRERGDQGLYREQLLRERGDRGLHLDQLRRESEEARRQQERALRELEHYRGNAPEMLHVEPGAFMIAPFPGAARGESEESPWIRELIHENLIEDPENYHIVLTDKYLRIDGDKQPQAIFERYKRKYETYAGRPMTDKTKVEITKSNR